MSIRKVQAQLRSRAQKHIDGMKRGMYLAAELLKEESLKIVPRQSGKLAESCFIKEREGRADILIEVGYSDPKAAYVHEIIENAHGKNFNTKHADKIKLYKGGHPIWFKRKPKEQAKFLETPARLLRTRMKEIIKAEAKK